MAPQPTQPPGTSAPPSTATVPPASARHPTAPSPGGAAAAPAAGTPVAVTATGTAAGDGIAASGPAMPATPADIEALADSLSGCADVLHERIMEAIRQRGKAAAQGHGAGTGQGIEQGIEERIEEEMGQAIGQGIGQGIDQDTAQALFDQEVLLRQSANRLYVQAAVLATAGLGSVRVQLMEVTAAARDQLRRVAKVQALVALTAELVTLARAIAAGKPGQWPAAVRDVRERVNELRDAGNA